mmetsp:Transcript_64826/g.150750  ORF Transcript_64826/g.150750 Transcript_64826/m.150750 type:complete len:436 (-) Transcript_64826:21-1328(-)
MRLARLAIVGGCTAVHGIPRAAPMAHYLWLQDPTKQILERGRHAGRGHPVRLDLKQTQILSAVLGHHSPEHVGHRQRKSSPTQMDLQWRQGLGPHRALAYEEAASLSVHTALPAKGLDGQQRAEEGLEVLWGHKKDLVGASVHEKARALGPLHPDNNTARGHPEAPPPTFPGTLQWLCRRPGQRAGPHGRGRQLAQCQARTAAACRRHQREQRRVALVLHPLVQRSTHNSKRAPGKAADAVPGEVRGQGRVLDEDERLVVHTPGAQSDSLTGSNTEDLPRAVGHLDHPRLSPLGCLKHVRLEARACSHVEGVHTAAALATPRRYPDLSAARVKETPKLLRWAPHGDGRHQHMVPRDGRPQQLPRHVAFALQCADCPPVKRQPRNHTLVAALQWQRRRIHSGPSEAQHQRCGQAHGWPLWHNQKGHDRPPKCHKKG